MGGSIITPRDLCKHCLPDCSTTKYETSVSYGELQKCDGTTTGGTNLLCKLVDGSLNPAPWMKLAQDEFERGGESLPPYLKTLSDDTHNLMKNRKFSNKRSRLHAQNGKSVELFQSELLKNPWYDAFEKDIGIINVFFAEKKITKYVTANRMTIFDFISNIGGSLGLAMGISILSVVELIYWITFRLFSNLLA